MRICAIVLMCILASAGSGCGTMAYDCSGGSGDGQGGCIPFDKGPTPAQHAALRFFGPSADQVACFNQGSFRRGGRRIHAWGCKAIQDGVLQHQLHCVFLAGSDVVDAEPPPAVKARCAATG